MKTVQKTTINLLLSYLSGNPTEKLPRIFSLVEAMDKNGEYAQRIRTVKEHISDETGVWHGFVEDLFREVDLKLIKKVVECFFINATLAGAPKRNQSEEMYGCNIPWAILMDPTSACNLSCTGCWAAQYGNQHNLSLETLDSICKQGKELGTYFYIFSGGEPLMRKKDIIKLCKANQDCYFFAFTNGTLVDDSFCEEMRQVGNLTLAFSIEGEEAATDLRRGEGTYRKVLQGMERMRAHGLLFGYSTCYHRYNTQSVGSDTFVDDMIRRGCRFSWNFTYMPVGKDASLDLLATPEQRSYMYHRVREIRNTKPLFALDFWNDGEFTHGCIAGGRDYLHINAAGDVEPCAFVHYSNVNIHDVSLLEGLQSPLFMAYRNAQPFDQNHLRPCPILDHPEAIVEMVTTSHASSTEMAAPEDVGSLYRKTIDASSKWAPVAEMLWGGSVKSSSFQGTGQHPSHPASK